MNRKLQDARRKKFLSREGLARRIGTSERQIYRWESGSSRPNYKYRKKLCEFFSTSASDLGIEMEEELLS